MSDAHHGCIWRPNSNDPLMSQFLMDHPEWANTWDGDEVMLELYGHLDATLNYAVPEVQAHRLQILREMATNYDIDGLELNWMRWCRHFPAGTQREHCDDLTSFVGQVRAMLDEVAKAKGVERMILGHRVPVTIDESLNIGCDVQTWAKNGYADFLAPMDFIANDLNTRTDEFVEAVRGANCPVYPGSAALLTAADFFTTSPGFTRMERHMRRASILEGCGPLTSSERRLQTGMPGARPAGRASTCICGNRGFRSSSPKQSQSFQTQCRPWQVQGTMYTCRSGRTPLCRSTMATRANRQAQCSDSGIQPRDCGHSAGLQLQDGRWQEWREAERHPALPRLRRRSWR